MPPNLWILLLLLLLLQPTTTAKLFLTIKANDDICLEEEVITDLGLRGRFEVVEGGYLDIDVRVHKNSRRDKVLKEFVKAQEGDLDIPNGGKGKYFVCFTNRMSTLTAKTVAFTLHGGIGELIEDEEVAKQSMVKPLERLVETLADKLQKLQDQEKYLNDRIRRHGETAKSTSIRVSVVTGIEALFLILVNTLQLLFLTSYFERRLTT
jgi:hypothetical protein